MPIYEYECAACGHKLEAIQKISDAPLTECPSCKAQALHKLVSAAAFHLKGSGWYVTDFKDKPRTGDADKQSGDTKDTKTDEGGKPEKQETGSSETKTAGTGKDKTTSTTGSD